MTKDQQIIFEVSPNMKHAIKEKLVRENGTFRELGIRLFSEYLQRECTDEASREEKVLLARSIVNGMSLNKNNLEIDFKHPFSFLMDKKISGFIPAVSKKNYSLVMGG